MADERLIHLEREVKALRIQVKALVRVCAKMGSRIHGEPECLLHADSYYWLDILNKASKDAADVFKPEEEPPICEHWHSKLRGDLCCAPNERGLCPCDGVKEECPDA